MPQTPATRTNRQLFLVLGNRLMTRSGRYVEAFLTVRIVAFYRLLLSGAAAQGARCDRPDLGRQLSLPCSALECPLSKARRANCATEPTTQHLMQTLTV